jgi:serine/threonine protein kinase
MDPRRWLNIAELYQSALPLTPEQRNSFLATTCASDTVLQQELKSLLEAHESSGEFLNEPIFEQGLKLLVDPELKSNEQDSPADQQPDDFVGATVDGRYEVVDKLGSGGIGDVYRAKDRKLLGRAVVIKILKDSSLSKPWIVSKFEQEIEALTKIADAGVVGVIDAGKLPNGKPYLVMEFVEGCNLREFMQRRDSANARVAFSEVADIVKQVGRTLTAAHDAGIIHRDLKPANIMLRRTVSGDLQVKVIDFGIAKITNSASSETTTTGFMAGTLAYMAPEQLEGRKVTPASDIYALGIIAYEMITGSRPFNPETPALLPEFQRRGLKVLPRDLRPGLSLLAQNAVLKALSYQSGDRYPRARDFGDALADALNTDEPAVQSRDEPDAEPARSEEEAGGNAIPTVSASRRHRAAGLILGTILLPILVGLVYVWSNRPNESIVRTLTYSLTVHKQNGQQPVQSSGQERFSTGDRFRLNVFSRESGYLYVLNEGAEDGGGTIFTLIYPTPETNKGSAKLEAPIIQTAWNTFAGPPDKEEFWIIWSATPIAPLEEAKNAALNIHEGKISSAAVVRKVRDFLLKNADPSLDTFNDSAKQQVDLKAKNDPLIKLVELEYQ